MLSEEDVISHLQQYHKWRNVILPRYNKLYSELHSLEEKMKEEWQ
jgi:hypothetical protein